MADPFDLLDRATIAVEGSGHFSPKGLTSRFACINGLTAAIEEHIDPFETIKFIFQSFAIGVEAILLVPNVKEFVFCSSTRFRFSDLVELHERANGRNLEVLGSSLSGTLDEACNLSWSNG